MADYYPLIAKAVAGLPQSTPETRRAIYDRAHAALVGQLGKLQPPVPPEIIEREAAALDAAVTRLEAEIVGDGSSDLAEETETPPPAPQADIADIKATPKLLPNSTAESPIAPRSSPPRLFKSPLAQPSNDKTPLGSLAASESGALAGNARINDAPVLKMPTPPSAVAAPEIELHQNLEEAAEAPQPADLEPSAAGPAAGDMEPDLARPVSSLIKERAESQRPYAPQPRAEFQSTKRLWIFGAVLGLVVVIVAVIAWQLRDRPENLVHMQALPSSPAPESNAHGKIIDRLEGGQTADVRSPVPSGDLAKGTAEAGPAQASNNPGANPSALPNGSPPAMTAVPLRAALLIETPNEQSKITTLTGTAQWRLDNVSNGPDEPLSTAVRADIDIPEAKLQVSMIFQKNFDLSLPASHTIKVRYVEQAGSGFSAVQQISVPQMRRQDASTGEALNGVPVPIMENSFLVGLSRGTAEQDNIELIKTRDWIDFPMLLANGHIAKLTFEKGASGAAAINEALASWAAQ
jgi:hypothetical protein